MSPRGSVGGPVGWTGPPRKHGKQKIEQQRRVQIKVEMKRKVGKESEEGSKKREELGNEAHLSSLFQKQQTVNDLQKSRETYNSILILEGKQLGLESLGGACAPVRKRHTSHCRVGYG